ncbi:MAG: hypothetical protein COU69_04680 [Candidatus Pacebacteria bacterium CG10_big_fil_rev_8_21_14_0_10_56_10]|nr:MAG: hypothetical protein COU69_04680 [Candidatus Pacebacteria bacterium CG10_big_fil_rev_8_21_14_0_10_56_10]
MKIDNSEYRRKLNGYRCSHRNRWLLLSAKIISLQALSLLEFYIDISDFDQKHEAYGTYQVYFDEIAKIFTCSQGTIRNWHKELVMLKLISPTKKKGVYKLYVPKRYISPGFWRGEASTYAKEEKGQSVEVIFQSMKKEFEPAEKNDQPNDKNSDSPVKDDSSIALGSSKDEYKISQNNGLSEEDKRWLGDNLLE